MRDFRTVMLEWTRRAPLFLALAALGCGAPAPEPEPEPTTGEETLAEPEPPPPPPPPARLRVVHASPEPTASTITIAIDDAAPALTALSLHAGTDYVEVTPGAHALVVRGASAEGAEPTELARASTPELASDAHYTAVVHGLAAGDPPLQITSLDERAEAPTEGAAGVRLFHALVGTDAVDACIAGATPRDRATLLHGALAYGTAGDAYVDLSAEGELQLQLRAPHAAPCRGRLLGVARTALTAGANHTFVLLGHPTARPRVERELVVCTEGDVASCIAVPVTSR